MNLSEDALRKLQSYNWPGNIRELENVIHRAVTLNEGSLLLSDTLPQKIQTGEVSVNGLKIELPEEGLNIEEWEKGLLQAALVKASGNQTQAAKLLGLSRPTLIYRLQKFQIMKHGT